MPRKKTLLSRLPKSARDEIKWLMEERDGNLALQEFLALRWEYSQPNWLWHFQNEHHARRMEENRTRLAERFPQRSEEEIDLMMRNPGNTPVHPVDPVKIPPERILLTGSTG